MRIRLLAPQTAAESAGINLNSKNSASVTLIASGLAGVEEVDIEIYNGVAFVPYRNNSGTIVTLTATNYMQVLPGGVLYRVKKDATAAPGGIVAYLAKQSIVRS